MMNFSYEPMLDDHNPLDFVEELASHKSWYYKRVDSNTLSLQLAGQRSKFDLTLQWNEEFCALNILSCIDVAIKGENRDVAADFLMQTNEEMWMGHFIIDTATSFPCFKYTMLLEHIPSAVSVEMVNDIGELAVTECDRYYSTFVMLSNGSIQSHETLSTALMKTIGEA